MPLVVGGSSRKGAAGCCGCRTAVGIPLPSPVPGARVVQEQAELAQEEQKHKQQVHCQLLKPEGQRIAVCVKQKAWSPALSQILGVLQAWLCRDRNRSAMLASSVCPSPHLPSPIFPSLPVTSPPPPLLSPLTENFFFFFLTSLGKWA